MPRRVLRPDPLPGKSAPLGEGEGNRLGEETRRPKGTAHDRALRLLGVRARSRRELEDRLLRAGFEPTEVEEAIDGLEAAGLVDDERLAQAVVDHAVNRRLAGRRAVVSALRTHRVDPDLVERALEEADQTEAERVHELAARRAERLRGLAPEVAARRLVAFLVRRGYGPGLSREAASRALTIDPQE